MTPDQQRITIAEACGWVRNPAKHTAKILDWLHTPSGSTAYHPPDYLNDLNACHKMEKVLTPTQLDEFDRWLMANCGAWQTAAIHATAAQRCEAFLRSMTLWTT